MDKKNFKVNTEQKGVIVYFFSGIARIKGLSGVFLNEVLLDVDGNEVGMVLGYDNEITEAIFWEENFDVSQPVLAGGKSVSLKVSDSLLGRVVNGLGHAIDGLGPIKGAFESLFKFAPQTIDRGPLIKPLSTGIKIIDTSLPLGRGQRELIVGDRKIGKSTLAIDMVLNQKHAEHPVYCVYVVLGQKDAQLRKIVDLFEKENAFLYSTIVGATTGCSFAEQYLAPFVGCTIGEYWRDMGKDVLVVYDDLSKHAKVFRNISLLLERPPGRESYPGDIFSLHAGLLERAAMMSKDKGGGSLTALPIIETLEGDITDFIATNIISITDGQIYLERGLFQKGFMPAVNVGLSVSRVGSAVQPKLLHEVTKGIRLSLAQHKELQKLSQLETTVSNEAQKKIHRGDLTLELLKQRKHSNVTWEEQVVLFYVVEEGFFDDVSNEQWAGFEQLILELLRTQYMELLEKIKKGIFNDKVKSEIKLMVSDFKQEFLDN